MKRVNKYAINESGQRVSMPIGAKFLHVQRQGNNLCLWVEVETHKPFEERVFEVIGTGYEVAANLKYVGTAVFEVSGLVLHLYERIAN